MEGDWLTYVEAAERLNTTPEGVRQRAIRKRWQRTVGNDGLARVRLPEGLDAGRTAAERRRANAVRTPSERRTDGPTIKALEAHVETLKAQLIAAEGRGEAERVRADQAIAAFASLADRLDQLAHERRPWWRKLIA
jgi:hypothetical protein